MQNTVVPTFFNTLPEPGGMTALLLLNMPFPVLRGHPDRYDFVISLGNVQSVVVPTCFNAAPKQCTEQGRPEQYTISAVA